MINRQKIIRYTGPVLAYVCLMFVQPAAATSPENLPRLTTDSEGHMVCHLCGPEKKDSYFLAEYPQGYKEKTGSYSKIWDMERYAILMFDGALKWEANQTPTFFYIDKLSSSPKINIIEFDSDMSNLSAARNVYVTNKGGTTLLRVRWSNGERNSFSLDNHAPAYQARFYKDKADKLYCQFCGGREQSVYVINADDSSLYNQVIDTTYFLLMHQDMGTSCPAGGWYAISKTSEKPEAKEIDGIGCDEITDFTPSAENGVTHLNIRYFNGNRKTLTLQNP
ncbi:hypothetical protein ACE60T_001801 [Salmonella enterica]